MYTNAQSLLAHKDEISHQSRSQKRMSPAFVALSETRITEDIDDYEVNVPGYNVVRCDAENRSTGGVILYVKSNIKYEVVLTKKIIANCWCIVIEVQDNTYKGVIIVIYHSPSASDGDFIRWLDEIVESVTVKGKCILVGDFNIDMMVNSFYAKKLRTTMLSLGMKQFVDKPTRSSKDSQTIIDLVFANNKVIVKVCDKPKITDHAWLKIEMKALKSNDNYKIFSGRDYSRFNIDKFVELLEMNNIQGHDLSINMRAGRLIAKIVDSLNIAAPKKIFRIPNVWYGKKWFSNDIRIAASERDATYRKAVSTDEEQDWYKYKAERNRVVRLIKNKKKEYNEKMIDQNKNDPTTMWKTLKEVIRGDPIESKIIENIDFEIDVVNECNIAGKCNIADKFNLFYVESINDIVRSTGDGDGINSPKKVIYAAELNSTMESFEIIETKYVEKIVMGLTNKKGTEEGISSELLKSIFYVIKDELVGVINDSLRTGPDGWKTSTIIPIPKVNKQKGRVNIGLSISSRFMKKC